MLSVRMMRGRQRYDLGTCSADVKIDTIQGIDLSKDYVPEE